MSSEIIFKKGVLQIKTMFTEDEISNLLIDIWQMEQEMKKNNEKPLPSSGETVTVTITSDSHYR